MVVALASDLTQDWFLRLSAMLADEAMVLPVTAATAVDLAQRLPVSILLDKVRSLYNVGSFFRRVLASGGPLPRPPLRVSMAILPCSEKP